MPEDTDVVVSQEDAQYIIERQRREIDHLKVRSWEHLRRDLVALASRLREFLESYPDLDPAHRRNLVESWGNPFKDDRDG